MADQAADIPNAGGANDTRSCHPLPSETTISKVNDGQCVCIR